MVERVQREETESEWDSDPNQTLDMTFERQVRRERIRSRRAENINTLNKNSISHSVVIKHLNEQRKTQGVVINKLTLKLRQLTKQFAELSLKVDSEKNSMISTLNSLPLKWHLYSTLDEKFSILLVYTILQKAIEENVVTDSSQCTLSLIECENKTKWKGYRIQC